MPEIRARLVQVNVWLGDNRQVDILAFDGDDVNETNPCSDPPPYRVAGAGNQDDLPTLLLQVLSKLGAAYSDTSMDSIKLNVRGKKIKPDPP